MVLILHIGSDLVVEELQSASPDRGLGELKQMGHKRVHELLGRLTRNKGRKVVDGNHVEARSNTYCGIIEVGDLHQEIREK